jgi:hypothetical protein
MTTGGNEENWLGTGFEEPDLGGEGIDFGPPREHLEMDPELVARADEEALAAVDVVESEAPEYLVPDDEVRRAHSELEARLLTGAFDQAMSAEAGSDGYGVENVVGVGIAEKHTGGIPTGQLGVTVYVVRKAPPEKVRDEALVPSDAGGVQTDVVATGEFRAEALVGRYRPVPDGVSCGHFKITAGTLGCLVKREKRLYILSNNHVLANVNAAAVGDPILQPGPIDGGTQTDVIAKLSAAVPIQFGAASNTVDCAIAQTSPRLMAFKNSCLGQISTALATCSRGLIVRKCGRTTGHTRGVITDCSATIRVGYEAAGAALFTDQILINGLPPTATFSQGGDSGSLILAEKGLHPVGLLFAGSSTHTIANKIKPVLASFGVTIVA